MRQDPRTKPIPTPWQEPIDHWLAHLAATGATPQSIATRRDHARASPAHWGSTPSAVTSEQLITWAAHQQWARETRSSVYNSARHLFGYLRAASLIEVDPAAALPAVRPTEPRPRPTPEVVYRTALADVTERRVRVALRLAAEAGLRAPRCPLCTPMTWSPTCSAGH